MTGSSQHSDGAGKETDAIKPDKPKLPKRFYKDATVAPCETGFMVHLDGRTLRTPQRNALAVPTERLAEQIAKEWRQQGDEIDPTTMALTRLANSTLDGVIPQQSAVINDIAKYAGHDLVCYRAEGPKTLSDRQRQAWDPVIDWAETCLGVRWVCSAGVIPVEQPGAAASAVRAKLAVYNPFQLAALHEITSLTGSALMALHYGDGQRDIDEVWASAHIDEAFQAEQWGEDAVATARRTERLKEAKQADRFFHLASNKPS